MTPWTAVHQASLSVEFFRQEYWSGLPLPSPGDLPNPGTELGSPASQADSLPSEPPGPCLLILYIVEGNSTPLQYSCLENPMDGGAWYAAVHEIAKSWTRLSDFTFTFHFHALEKEMATPVFLPGESQGRGSLVGCCLWGHTESDTTEVS